MRLERLEEALQGGRAQNDPETRCFELSFEQFQSFRTGAEDDSKRVRCNSLV